VRIISKTLSKYASLVTQNYLEGKRMNKEYLQAKANLCSELAQEQLTNGDEREGVENLKRMIRALEEINMINYLEERRGRR
jgi:hypothetical protein